MFFLPSKAIAPFSTWVDIMRSKCPHGPDSPRRPGRSDCAACHREQERERRRRNGSRPRTRADVCAKRGHVLNDETRRPGRADCAICHRLDQSIRNKLDIEAARTRARNYARGHHEEARARSQKWRAANVEYVRSTARRIQRERKAGRTPEGKEYVDILRADPCCYCGISGGHIDHIVPLSKAGPNAWDNLTSACKSCNSRKRDKSLLMFLLATVSSEGDVVVLAPIAK